MCVHRRTEHAEGGRDHYPVYSATVGERLLSQPHSMILWGTQPPVGYSMFTTRTRGKPYLLLIYPTCSRGSHYLREIAEHSWGACGAREGVRVYRFAAAPDRIRRVKLTFKRGALGNCVLVREVKLELQHIFCVGMSPALSSGKATLSD